MIRVCEPTLRGNELKYVSECIKTNWISSNGPFVTKFEKMFSKYCGAKYGVACCNGTVALHLALESLGIKEGDEVIIPDFTMIATANAVIYANAKPVLVDSDVETWCIDVTLIEEKITDRTKAIIPVHIYGHPCDMQPIRKIARKYGLYVLEDAAEAHGAEYRGKKCGSLGTVAAFSFYANKIITTGEGGMVLTNNKQIAKKAELLRNHAFAKRRFVHRMLGFNYRMTNLQAAVGVAQMEYIDDLIEARRRNAKLYNEFFEKADWITTPPEKPWAKNVYWMYGVLINKKAGMSVNKIRMKLAHKGIETRPFFVPMHRQPIYKRKDRRFPDLSGEFPVADMLSKSGFYLPSSSSLTESQIEYIAKALLKLKR